MSHFWEGGIIPGRKFTGGPPPKTETELKVEELEKVVQGLQVSIDRLLERVARQEELTNSSYIRLDREGS